MVPLKRFVLLVLFFVFLPSYLFGCAKVGYLWDQGWGQMSLLNRAKPNEEVLKDPKVSEEIKIKIRRIQEFKTYFYKFWGRPATGIYSETTLLDQKAVTHLVIASPYNEVKALDHCFPFMGCFPYLGFFSETKAKAFAQELGEEEQETYVRPVYAYSTLGYFEDKILSSFFYFKDYELAELIFHELFHTIFFVKDEVALNEALANHFSRLMAFEYFELSDNEKKGKMLKKAKIASLSAAFAKEISLYNQKLKNKSIKTKEELHLFREIYMRETLYPRMKKFCAEKSLMGCFPIEREWNNASLAAFMTYEDKGNDLQKLQKEKKWGMKEYFDRLEKAYQRYEKADVEEKFSKWLFKNI